MKKIQVLQRWWRKFHVMSYPLRTILIQKKYTFFSALFFLFKKSKSVISDNTLISILVLIMSSKFCVSAAFIEIWPSQNFLQLFCLPKSKILSTQQILSAFIFLCVHVLHTLPIIFFFEKNKQISNWFNGLHLHRESIIAIMFCYFGFLIGSFPRAKPCLQKWFCVIYLSR